MEKKIYNQLRKGTQARRASDLSADATDREIRRAAAHGPILERLPEFTTEQLESLLIDDEIISELVRTIGQGKEANVYWVRDDRGRDMALKVFRLYTTSHSFGKIEDTGRLQMVEGLALQEYMNLSYAQEAGVRVPAPVRREEFILTMDYLGDHTDPAPLLLDVDLIEEGQDPIAVLEEILEEMYLLFNTAEMVHGDFSEHNLIWYDQQIWTIDFLQAQRWHPHFDTVSRIRKREALENLRNDVQAILQYFARTYRQTYGIDEVMEEMVEKPVDDMVPDHLMSEYYNPTENR